jgi:hypothetical protein
VLIILQSGNLKLLETSGSVQACNGIAISLGPGIAVGIATRYRLDGPGIESQGGRDFTHLQTGCEAHPVTSTMGTGSLLGVKRPGRGIDYPPPSRAEVKQRVELYL